MKTYMPNKDAHQARNMNGRVLAMSAIGVVFALLVIYIIYSIAMPVAPMN